MIQIYSDNLNSQPIYYLQASGQQTYPKNEIALMFPYILKISHTLHIKTLKWYHTYTKIYVDHLWWLWIVYSKLRYDISVSYNHKAREKVHGDDHLFECPTPCKLSKHPMTDKCEC